MKVKVEISLKDAKALRDELEKAALRSRLEEKFLKRLMAALPADKPRRKELGLGKIAA